MYITKVKNSFEYAIIHTSRTSVTLEAFFQTAYQILKKI